jgi:hypothetical protein
MEKIGPPPPARQHTNMKTLILKLAALAGVVALVAALWPIFT